MQAVGAPPDRTWMIGDSVSDVEAARAAGVRSGLLFADNRCELCPLRGGPNVQPDRHAAKLPLLARAILDSN
jgi:D-glycero-D-manno-heptose 1,7-bisphosphate phosphatase